MNQFAGVLTSATEAVASGMNTQTKGIPVVVYNSLNIAREDVVEAKVNLPAGATSVRVSGPDGKEVPAQLADGKVLFLAKVPSVGYAVYDVQAGSVQREVRSQGYRGLSRKRALQPESEPERRHHQHLRQAGEEGTAQLAHSPGAAHR